MKSGSKYIRELSEKGFSVIENVFSEEEITGILSAIEAGDSTKETFRKTNDLFAIRQFLKEVPDVFGFLFNDKLKKVIHELLGENAFVVKSIYFDKPESSNWYVAWHQDLTISVDQKLDLEGFGPWTVKQNQFAVQPPLDFLENITTIRIHLDDTNENNGALKVIPGSHRKRIYRPETIDWELEREEICSIKRGGIMLMKPLTMHSSGRTTDGNKRRVVHIEFANRELPAEIRWSERMELDLFP